MNTNIYPKSFNLSNLNNPQLNISRNNGHSIRNSLLTQNSLFRNSINPLDYHQKLKIINIPNNISNRSNSAINIKPSIIKKNELNSSGTLIKSKNSKKENKVKKNGVEICNIDINKDFEETKNAVNQNKPINYIYKRNLINKDQENLNNNLYNNNNLNKNLWDKRIPNENYVNPDGKPFVNPMVRFVNFIVDIFSTNKNGNNSNNEIINQNENNNPPLNSEKKDLQNKLNENIISSIKSNNEINNINNNNNQSEGSNLEKNTSIILNRNNSYTNLNQNLTLNKIGKPPINHKKNNYFTLNKNPKASLSQILKKNLKSKKNELNSSNKPINKFPFQPLNSILNPKNNTNIKEKLNVTNTNSCNNLNGNLQKLNQPQINNIIYQKKYIGFRFCHELTKAGKEMDGNTKTDQDAPLIKLNIDGIIGFNMFGVLDGHGPHGHLVSQFCKEYFIKNITLYTELLKKNKGISTCDEIYYELKINNFYIILELFKNVDKEISSQNIFEYNTSGTTCNLVFQFNKHLICFNVGDSRSIIIYDEGNNRNQGIFPLSIDHKPNLPGEYERIKLSGGEVHCLKDYYGNDIGPPRVYKVNSEYPSLAMSRSLGDFLAKEVGVVSIPQIIEYDINFTTKYLVICSDGVWEFIPNEQVRNIGNNFYAKDDVVGFCTELILFSTKLWEQNDIIRDDITVVSVFF